jgi:hypothetical protein
MQYLLKGKKNENHPDHLNDKPFADNFQHYCGVSPSWPHLQGNQTKQA